MHILNIADVEQLVVLRQIVQVVRVEFLVVILSVATPALAGRLEDVRDRFNQVQSDYAETKNYVDSGNIDSAKSATAKLNEDTNKVCSFTQDIKDRIAELLQPDQAALKRLIAKED